eukprot:PITA_11576
MAALKQVFQNKRRMLEIIISPVRRRPGVKARSAVNATLKTTAANLKPVRDSVNEVEVEMMLNWVKRSLEDEIVVKVKTHNNFESTHEKRSNDKMGSNKQGELIVEVNSQTGLKTKTGNNFESTHEKHNTDQMGSNKQGELTVEVNSERTTLLTSDVGEFTYHDDVLADSDLFVDNMTHDEFGIMMQYYLDQDSVPDLIYSDTMHGHIESTEASYGSLTGDDILLLNELPVIRNDFASPQPKEIGISGGHLISGHQ